MITAPVPTGFGSDLHVPLAPSSRRL